MAELRSGRFGEYYGSLYNQSEYLSTAQHQKNATYIFGYLSDKGWSINAIAAILGNMEAESSINPGRWQSGNVGYMNGGYGLCQWTPASKYISWCSETGKSDPSEMDNNLDRIMYEIDNGIQWIKTDNYNYSFSEFSKSDKTVRELAIAFLLNYERPANQSADVQNYRADLAIAWYEYLTGATPPDPDPDYPEPTPGYKPAKRRKFNFILFNQRRKSQWIKRRF